MGLFSGIKKLVKKVIGGIKKIFKPIIEPIAKFFNSKLGKIILIGAAVFTAGMALYAGWTAAAATQGSMMAKFLSGSKAFLSAIVNPIQSAKAALGNTGIFAEGAGIAGMSGAKGIEIGAGNLFSNAGMDALGASTIAGPGNVLVEGGGISGGVAGTEAGTAAAGAEAGGQGAFGMGGEATVTGGGPASMPSPAQVIERSPSVTTPDWSGGGGMLSKSADMVKTLGGKFSRYAQTTGGGLLLSNMLQGYSQGKIAERQEEERRRREAEWANSPGLDRLRDVSTRRLQAPSNWGQGSPSPDQFWQIRNQYRHQPPIPYSSGG